MSFATQIRCDQNAFAFCGGWPRRILSENMRNVFIGRDRINSVFMINKVPSGAYSNEPYEPLKI